MDAAVAQRRALVSIASSPPIAAVPLRPGWLAGRPAAGLVPGLIRRPRRRLKRAAQVLGSDSPDTGWHAVRIRAKRCRYTAEAVAPICGHQAKWFAAAIAEVQALLGGHQDTVVAEAWLRDAAVGVPAAYVTAGQLIAAEQLERGNLRSNGWRSGNGHRPSGCAAGSDQLAAGSPGWLPGPGPAAEAA